MKIGSEEFDALPYITPATPTQMRVPERGEGVDNTAITAVNVLLAKNWNGNLARITRAELLRQIVTYSRPGADEGTYSQMEHHYRESGRLDDLVEHFRAHGWVVSSWERGGDEVPTYTFAEYRLEGSPPRWPRNLVTFEEGDYGESPGWRQNLADNSTGVIFQVVEVGDNDHCHRIRTRTLHPGREGGEAAEDKGFTVVHRNGMQEPGWRKWAQEHAEARVAERHRMDRFVKMFDQATKARQDDDPTSRALYHMVNAFRYELPDLDGRFHKGFRQYDVLDVETSPSAGGSVDMAFWNMLNASDLFWRIYEKAQGEEKGGGDGEEE